MNPAETFQPLSALDLDVEAPQLRALFLPFAMPVSSAEVWKWRRDLWRRRRLIAKRLLRGYLSGGEVQGRGAEKVLEEYSRAWSRIDYGIYDPAAPARKSTPWRFGAERFFASDVGATRVRQLLLTRVIEKLRPRRVLEVGCGNGINLLLAAGRFPDVAFTGVELTAAGGSAARAFQQDHAEVPASLKHFAPEPLQDVAAFRRVEFVQADAAAMPFAEGSFDLVFSMLALEQMEAFRARALAELARVCGRAYFGIEPFREANPDGWRRLYVKQRGYFAGRISELREVGLTPQWATMDFPQEVFLGASAVLAERG